MDLKQIILKIKNNNTILISLRCPPLSTEQSMDVLFHVKNELWKKNKDNIGTYVEDGLRPSLIGSSWEDSLGHRDVQGIDDEWEFATREVNW